MFEHRTQPIVSRRLFAARLFGSAGVAAVIIAVSLALGTLGYRLTEGLAWLDAAVGATMLLTGMGPLISPRTDAGKVFTICFAMYSGLVLLTTVAIVFAPVLHRLLHHLHLDADDDRFSP